MKLRGPFVAIIILVALTGFLYWSNHHKPGEDSTVKASPNSAQILSLKQGDVLEVTIESKDQGRVDLGKNDSGAWRITEPSPLAADQEAVSSLLSTLSTLDS